VRSLLLLRTPLVTNSQKHRIWEQLQNSDVPPPQEDMAKWEAEFNQLMSSQREELEQDYGADMQEAWEAGLGNYQNISQDESIKFDEDGLPILGEYQFGTFKILLFLFRIFNYFIL
jgi:peroxin-5